MKPHFTKELLIKQSATFKRLFVSSTIRRKISKLTSKYLLLNQDVVLLLARCEEVVDTAARWRGRRTCPFYLAPVCAAVGAVRSISEPRQSLVVQSDSYHLADEWIRLSLLGK